MRKRIFTSVIILLSLSSATAQEVADSAAVAFNDSLFQSLPELMVNGNKPIVKVEGAKLVFDVNKLTKDKPVDNAFDALKHLPGVTPQDDDINLGGMQVALMVNGKLTSMSREQVITLLKSMPASRVKTAEVMYSAPARYQVRGALINLTLSKEASKDISLQGELYAKLRTHVATLILHREEISRILGNAECNIILRKLLRAYCRQSCTQAVEGVLSFARTCASQQIYVPRMVQPYQGLLHTDHVPES